MQIRSLHAAAPEHVSPSQAGCATAHATPQVVHPIVSFLSSCCNSRPAPQECTASAKCHSVEAPVVVVRQLTMPANTTQMIFVSGFTHKMNDVHNILIAIVVTMTAGTAAEPREY